MRYNDHTDRDKIISEIVKDLDPEFDHPYFWNIGSMFVQDAKKLWNC